MRVNAIGHASWLLETSAGTILTDPVFFDPFEGGANLSYPTRHVDPGRLPPISCVFLSHRHFDHFDIRSLSALDRRSTVFYPGGDRLIEAALEALGFDRRKPMEPWRKARLRDVEIIATPSQVDWPEIGLLLRDGPTTLWSPIDTVTNRQIVETVIKVVGDVDCLLAQYSPIFQAELRDPTQLRAHDVEEYQWLLEIARHSNAHVVIPSAGGLCYATGEWQNSYGFPVTPRRFLADVSHVAPSAWPVLLDPGDRCLVSSRTEPVVARQCLDYVQLAHRPDDHTSWRLNPAVGITRFADTNPLGAAPAKATKIAMDYLSGQLIDDLRHESNSAHREAWRHWNATWQIDLYVPGLDGPAAIWWLDLTADRPRMADAAPEPVGHTVVAASGLHDLLTAGCSTYGYLFTDRTRHAARVLAVGADGTVTEPREALPEPLLAALTGPRDLDEQYVAAQLRQWHET